MYLSWQNTKHGFVFFSSIIAKGKYCDQQLLKHHIVHTRVVYWICVNAAGGAFKVGVLQFSAVTDTTNTQPSPKHLVHLTHDPHTICAYTH